MFLEIGSLIYYRIAESMMSLYIFVIQTKLQYGSRLIKRNWPYTQTPLNL